MGRSREGRFPAELRETMTLMEHAARNERHVAETLRDMAAHAEGEVAAKRLQLAEEALRGAQAAERHRERLQDLAQQWVVHAEVVRLHRLLDRATGALADLAHTQQGIADAFTALATDGASALAEERRQLAAAAAASACEARRQALDLRKLAETTAAGMPPPSPPSG